MFTTKATIVGGTFATLLTLLAPAACRQDVQRDTSATSTTSSAAALATKGVDAGLLYGRVTIADGTVYEGRLRFGGDEEALWGNYFNGFKAKNPWAAYVPAGQLPGERRSTGIFGVEVAWRHRADLGRPFMARFGDIARIEPRGRDLRVTLKSGTLFHLDRYAADDVADGLRIWDRSRGVVDLGEWPIRTIELLPAPESDTPAPRPLYGRVRTPQGDFTGLIQWDREECLGPDLLVGRTAEGDLSIRFETIRSIVRRSPDSSVATLLDGREIRLSGTRDVGHGNRGVYVDDPRFGRVLVTWDAFERVDFASGSTGTAPAYGTFPPGRPLAGRVVTRSGRILTGRLVYDLDESETTETLDAPSHGVDYTIPFDLVTSIVLPGLDGSGSQRARVSLRGGEELRLELAGDLGDGNAGMLVFVDGRERPEYVPWADVAQVDLDRSTEL